MNLRSLFISTGAMALLAIPAVSIAQNGWAFECIDPENMMPYSNPYGTLTVGNDLFIAHLGVVGTVTYGGQNGPCWNPARTLNAEGRLAFQIGPTGSVQSGFDDLMAVTFGAPLDPVGDHTYAKITKNGNTDGDSVLFGDGGLNTAFVGASQRYMVGIWQDGDVQAELEIRSLGDAARLRWRLTNLQAEPQDLGLFFASHVGMRTSGFQFDHLGNNQAHTTIPSLTGQPKFTGEGYTGFTVLPTTKPVRTERRYDSNNPKFPDWVDFNWGQTEPYGIRVENVPAPQFDDATSADLILIGNYFLPAGSMTFNNNLRLSVFGDATGTAEEADILVDDTAFIQRFPTQPVNSGQFREIVQYIRSTWSVGDYNDPYSVVLDAPQLIAADQNGQDGLTPNPMTVRTYIDNQYARIDREVTLNNVRMTIELGNGLQLANGEPATKTIPTVGPNQISFIDWQVESDGVTFGEIPVKVTIAPTPGPVKEIETTIPVAAVPRLDLPAGANLVGLPYNFNDTSFDAILGLQAGVDYLAFQWDPATLSYVPVSSAERGEGYWIVPLSDLGVQALNGANLAGDIASGGLLTTLRRGWNLIANPYNYPVRLSDLVVIADDAPENALTWVETVQNGFVSPALAYFVRDDANPNGGEYQFVTEFDDFLDPHEGYWLFVNTFNPIRISWPPVFTEGLPNAGRGPSNIWQNNEKKWRLQLVARTANSMDSQNYVGVWTDAKLAKQNSLPKPPAAPGNTLELSVMEEINGELTRMAQSLTHRSGKKEWKVAVRSDEQGDVTLTWPNLGDLPRNVRLTLRDDATGQTHDLRATSGYTYHNKEASTRQLTLSMEIGGSVRPVIGNVLVTGAGRSGNSPVTVSYALSANALVTVRVLNTTGAEVFTLSRGRSESAGENSVTWMLRDNANRAVAPGVYQVEILAETPAGDRVRKIVPVNVIR